MGSELDQLIMRLRMKSKEKENQNKPPITSPDVVETADFLFSQPLPHDGDSGPLLLATRKTNRKERYLVKHAYTDCACNEFVYTKLAQAMGYCMPDAVLFQRSKGAQCPYFKTEYIIGERYLNVVDTCPSYERVREQAINWQQFYAFYGLYSITGEGDGVEILMADDNMIYRVDTTDAFPVSNLHLDTAGVDLDIKGRNLSEETKKLLFSIDFSCALNIPNCELILAQCTKLDESRRPYFLEPFARIQDVRKDYIDDFLNTLCYFYPDFVGDFFKRYISALQIQCGEYLKTKR